MIVAMKEMMEVIQKIPGKLRSPSEDEKKPRDDSFKGLQRNRGTIRKKTEGKKASSDDENIVDNEEIINPENQL